LLGADIDVFCRRLRINYIFNGNEEDEGDDIGGPLVRNKSDWINNIRINTQRNQLIH